jgi:hypothetical protein
VLVHRAKSQFKARCESDGIASLTDDHVS